MEDRTKSTDSRWKYINGNIVYKKGVLQGDYLSVMLFILSLNPASFLLNKSEGYKMGPTEDRNKNWTQLFFVDDLKLFASTLNQAKYLLDVIRTFSREIGMTFGEDKCGFIYTKRGNRKVQGEP